MGQPREGRNIWQIGNDPSANYGNSNFDIPQAFQGIRCLRAAFR